MNKKKKVKKHWYLMHVHECPVCGSYEIFRERMYTRKPKNPEKRHTYFEHYDWCIENEIYSTF